MMQREINDEVNIYAAKKARELELGVILDLGGQDIELKQELIQNCTIVSPNETEITRLLKRPINVFNDEELKLSCDEIRKVYQNNNLEFLVKLGSKGCLFLDKSNNILKQKAFKIESMKIVDTTGAGDCFTGSFTSYYSKTKNLEKSLLFATAAAYKSITRFGASTSCPTYDEVLEVLSLANEKL